MKAVPAWMRSVRGRVAAHVPLSLLPRTAVTGAICDSPSRMAGSPMSPAWMMRSLPRSAATAIVGLYGTTILPRPSAAAEPAVTVVVKIAGIPWFNALSKGVEHGGKDFALDATMIGPANVDPAQQVKLVEDLIAKKVAVIGLVPLDVKVMEP